MFPSVTTLSSEYSAPALMISSLIATKQVDFFPFIILALKHRKLAAFERTNGRRRVENSFATNLTGTQPPWQMCPIGEKG